ncbi:MAG: hypothetical protein AAF749_06450 [Pseudomonadota bacterium]
MRVRTDRVVVHDTAAEDSIGKLKKSTLQGLASATIGALIYGSWAYYVNMADGAAMALRTSAVQGSFSFCLTLSMSLLLSWLYTRFGHSLPSAIASWLLNGVFIFSTAYGLQYAAGSKAILMTIGPGFLIGSAYAAAFLFSLHKSASHKSAGQESAGHQGPENSSEKTLSKEPLES